MLLLLLVTTTDSSSSSQTTNKRLVSRTSNLAFLLVLPVVDHILVNTSERTNAVVCFLLLLLLPLPDEGSKQTSKLARLYRVSSLFALFARFTARLALRCLR